MPQQIQVPGHGLVEFPDGMTDEQIVAAIKANPVPANQTDMSQTEQDVAYGQRRVNVIKDAMQNLVSPDFWKSVGHDLTNFPLPNPIASDQLKQLAGNVALSTMPITPMSSATRIGTVKPSVDEKLLNPSTWSWFNSSATPPTLTPTQQILANAQKHGLVVPPSEINPQALNITEGLASGGKAAVRQGASIIDAPKLDNLIKGDLGIKPNTTVTDAMLQGIRKKQGNIYQAVKDVSYPIKTDPDFLNGVQNLSGDFKQAMQEFPDLMKNPELDTLISSLNRPQMSAKGAVELSKSLRGKATANIRNYGDEAKQALGYAQRNAANMLEDLVSKNLVANGQADLAKQWENARTLIAKSHDAEAALSPTGHFNAKVIGRMFDSGKPMSGGFKTVGEFASTFPNAVQDVTKIGSPNVNNLKAVASTLMAGVGGVVGGPAGMLAGALPYIGPPLGRMVLFSKPFQSSLTRLPSQAVSNFPIQRGLLGTAAQYNNGLLE